MGTDIQYSPMDRGRNGKTIHIYGVFGMAAIIVGVCFIFAEQLRLIFGIALAMLFTGGMIELARRVVPIYLQASREKHEQHIRLQDQALRAQVLALGQRPGYSTKFEDSGTIEIIAPMIRTRVVEEASREEEPLQIEAPRRLPDRVRYEEIRSQIPPGHILVGVGTSGVETKERAVGACVWIVGLSGTGKTSTTTLRVDERKQDGHKFLGADPHFFKGESLFHAIYELEDGRPGPYQGDFLAPMGRTPEEILEVLKLFLNEFNARKLKRSPKPWQKITLLVDEVSAMMDKALATSPAEKEIIDLLPSIARICGQEARDFQMGGIFISQQATYLAWLRKYALMIIVHQLLQENEKRLATNGDGDVIEEMKYWPIGRTYVYGVGFQEGPRTVQQPLFEPKIDNLSFLPRDPWEDLGRYQEGNGEATGRETGTLEDINPLVLKKFLNDAGKMKAAGQSIDAILKAYDIAPGGRNNQNLKSLLEQEGA